MNSLDNGVRPNSPLVISAALVLCCLAILPCTAQEEANAWDRGGDFRRPRWQERGPGSGNPFYNSCFRVDSREGPTGFATQSV